LFAATKWRFQNDERDFWRRNTRSWSLVVQRIALVIYALTHVRREPVFDYSQFGKRKKQLHIDDDDVFAIFQEWCTAADAEQMGKHCEEEGLDQPSLTHLRAAKIVVAEWHLQNWTATQNATVGIAPSTRSIIKEFGRICEEANVHQYADVDHHGDSTKR
jgi:hypothetical protein